MREVHTFGPFDHGLVDAFTRADLEIYGVDHYCPSYTCRVYFNDPDVAHEEPTRDRPSYAGEFSVFGHETCWGGDGHCHHHQPDRRFDHRASHPLTPAFRRVMVTDALKAAIKAGPKITITVVLETGDANAATENGKRLLKCAGMQLSTFN